jgi:hypothetical protein
VEDPTRQPRASEKGIRATPWRQQSGKKGLGPRDGDDGDDDDDDDDEDDEDDDDDNDDDDDDDDDDDNNDDADDAGTGARGRAAGGKERRREGGKQQPEHLPSTHAEKSGRIAPAQSRMTGGAAGCEQRERGRGERFTMQSSS